MDNLYINCPHVCLIYIRLASLCKMIVNFNYGTILNTKFSMSNSWKLFLIDYYVI